MHSTLLSSLIKRHQHRSLTRAQGHDFASNDYLALAQHPRIAKAIIQAIENGTSIGAGASRLLRGNHPEHEDLEARAAAFFGAQSCLFMGGGYHANVALFSTLPQRGDLVLYDALIHASARDGMIHSKALCVETPHQNVMAMETQIKSWRAQGGKGQIWLAVESLYSMDGDLAPLADLMALAHAYEAFLVIDEAHATGVYGSNGRGLAADLEGEEQVIVLHTLGKALGGSGALLTMSPLLRDFMINRARAFIYATAPSPLMAIAGMEALRIVQDEPERRDALAQRVKVAREKMNELGFTPSPSHILPVILKDPARTLRVSHALQAAGYDVRAIRPPTVPLGTSRLRVSITLNVTETVIGEMFECLAREI